MQFRHVLVLHSFADAGMSARIRQIEANPILKNVLFEHIAVVDEERRSWRIAELNRAADRGAGSIFAQERRDSYGAERVTIDPLLREVVREEVEPILLSRIQSIRPDILIVHGGTIFTVATGAILQMLIDIREKFPGLPYALEGRQEWLSRTTSRSYHPFDRQMIKNQVRWVKANFVTDPDIDNLIGEIF